jgi:hypothetical protein
MESVVSARPTFIPANQVAKRLFVSPTIAGRVARAAGVRLKVLPGQRPRYHAGDVEELARRMVVGSGVDWMPTQI